MSLTNLNGQIQDEHISCGHVIQMGIGNHLHILNGLMNTSGKAQRTDDVDKESVIRSIRVISKYMPVAGMKANYYSSVPSFLPFVLVWKHMVL